jgi:hypothetical protein
MKSFFAAGSLLFSLFVGLFFAPGAQALPVADENAATSGVITIYPDHLDAHHYYLLPSVVVIARDPEGIPFFSYAEYRKNIFQSVGVMTMTLLPLFPEPETSLAEAAILKKDPAAQFSTTPFIASMLQLTGELPELIADNQCDHAAGLVDQEQAWSLILTSKGRALFLKALRGKTLFLTLNFAYEIQAVVRMADGTYDNQVLHFSMAARIDGGQLAPFIGITPHSNF